VVWCFHTGATTLHFSCATNSTQGDHSELLVFSFSGQHSLFSTNKFIKATPSLSQDNVDMICPTDGAFLDLLSGIILGTAA
jgi:hypothetical protein